MALTTIHTSNTPVDCHILKGRLESEGIQTFIYDENLIWVSPFDAVAVGGVKLKVPEEQAPKARQVLELISKHMLVDNEGSYNIDEALEKAIKKQDEILRIKALVRGQTKKQATADEIKSEILSKPEIEKLLAEEVEFEKLEKKEFSFSWKDFLAELFDFEGDIFEYLRQKPVEFYEEKELVERFGISAKEDTQGVTCPNCRSSNVIFGYATDDKWDVLYLIFSFLAMAPFPLIRKNTTALIVVPALNQNTQKSILNTKGQICSQGDSKFSKLGHFYANGIKLSFQNIRSNWPPILGKYCGNTCIHHQFLIRFANNLLIENDSQASLLPHSQTNQKNIGRP